ncbi:MAG: DUF86 domain-containing protein [Duncaniella sp.]|nr:DUF86 domain-containing protein [Muribaculum sp.]MCM1255860.1 DUF86 domain-containing protein [Duncaniella sp.]
MDRKIKKSLYDILERIYEIESYFEKRPRRFDVYSSDSLLKSAIHMNLSIIGEATNRILKLDSGIAISNARQIVGTRNYLIHGYDSLRLEMLWAIVISPGSFHSLSHTMLP